jgi:hypothetical protein
MKQYVALDCSLKQISVCVMTEQRRIVTQAVIAADAGSIAEFVRSHAPEAEVIGLESGPTSPWLGWAPLRTWCTSSARRRHNSARSVPRPSARPIGAYCLSVSTASSTRSSVGAWTQMSVSPLRIY